jgi:hypothetical protein
MLRFRVKKNRFQLLGANSTPWSQCWHKVLRCQIGTNNYLFTIPYPTDMQSAVHVRKLAQAEAAVPVGGYECSGNDGYVDKRLCLAHPISRFLFFHLFMTFIPTLIISA